MTEEARLREAVCALAKSLFDRGLTHGSTGNISARLPDGRTLVTPTGSSFGRLDPARLSLLDAGFARLGGDAPTKELPLHRAFLETRRGAQAVVHLHATHSVAASMLPGADAEDLLPPLTPYAVMQVGRVKLLPFFVPGDPAMGEAIRALEGRRAAVVLANHGPVVAGASLQAAVDAVEELEATARLALLTRGLNPVMLTDAQVAAVRRAFPEDRA
jgi:ribulose-5-phosphate 4-epimerase/fuculose-1-phosphate aldolase